ncbi:hypothetical protein GCM10009578_001870 [Streptomyces rhizosphaericus]|uniref:hypothetical protein n=1 Tax=Streptomyces rhizosphaericus TaxID=114699 RepID=UPI0033703231
MPRVHGGLRHRFGGLLRELRSGLLSGGLGGDPGGGSGRHLDGDRLMGQLRRDLRRGPRDRSRGGLGLGLFGDGLGLGLGRDLDDLLLRHGGLRGGLHDGRPGLSRNARARLVRVHGSRIHGGRVHIRLVHRDRLRLRRHSLGLGELLGSGLRFGHLRDLGLLGRNARLHGHGLLDRGRGVPGVPRRRGVDELREVRELGPGEPPRVVGLRGEVLRPGGVLGRGGVVRRQRLLGHDRLLLRHDRLRLGNHELLGHRERLLGHDELLGPGELLLGHPALLGHRDALLGPHPVLRLRLGPHLRLGRPLVRHLRLRLGRDPRLQNLRNGLLLRRRLRLGLRLAYGRGVPTRRRAPVGERTHHAAGGVGHRRAHVERAPGGGGGCRVGGRGGGRLRYGLLRHGLWLGHLGLGVRGGVEHPRLVRPGLVLGLLLAPGALGARHQQQVVLLAHVFGAVEEGVGGAGRDTGLWLFDVTGVGRRGMDIRRVRVSESSACVLRQSLARDLAGVGHAYPSPIASAPSNRLPPRASPLSKNEHAPCAARRHARGLPTAAPPREGHIPAFGQ